MGEITWHGMRMAIKSESSVSAARAARILSDLHDTTHDVETVALCGDWFVATTEDGGEYLVAYGEEEATAKNQTSTSWLGSV